VRVLPDPPNAPLALAGEDLLIRGDNLAVLPHLPGDAFDMIYIDPPFNTGRPQARATLRAISDPAGARTGFGGRRYRTEKVAGPAMAYDDAFDDLPAFLEPRLIEAHRLLAPHGTLYVHLDPRESHYVKVLLDTVFGRSCFLNELIWAYDYGAKPRRRWPAKHDVILVYVKDRDAYWFDDAEVDREPYMSPGLVTAEQQARGKRPTDVWWHTIVPTSGTERTGYPTQKPLGVVRRCVAASSRPGGWCLDFFAGSGTLGAGPALRADRRVARRDRRLRRAPRRRRRGGYAGVAVASRALTTIRLAAL
jgi:site-specific DNA-methyltransferase (adenine-specific)